MQVTPSMKTARFQVALLLTTIWATDSLGATNYATNVSLTAVQAAINAASDGDVVVVPAGSATWSTTLYISRAIQLLGAGTNLTHITSAGKAVSISPPNAQFGRISGFDFNGGGAQNWSGVVSLSGVVRMDNCWFHGARGWAVTADDCFGVIDHCLFTDYNGGVLVNHENWGGAGYGDGAWADGAHLGTTKATYVEDCAFYGDGQVGAIDSDSGAHWVFRYNYVEKDILVSHGTDSTGRKRSTRAFEIYQNVMIAPSNYENECRGGTGVIWSNTFTRYPGVLTLKTYREERAYSPWGQCNGTNPWDGNTLANGYPALDQCGRGKGDLLSAVSPTPVTWPHQASEPIYAWGNVNNGAPAKIGSGGYNTIQENRDFFNDVVMPGYVPLAYPHPLVSTPPAAPANLRVRSN